LLAQVLAGESYVEAILELANQCNPFILFSSQKLEQSYEATGCFSQRVANVIFKPHPDSMNERTCRKHIQFWLKALYIRCFDQNMNENHNSANELLQIVIQARFT